MKDLILITSFCDTFEKEQILRKLIEQVSLQENFFDVLLISHTTIPQDIQKMVNYFIYDQENELLKDWELRLIPYFIPENDRKINSALVYDFNTHLAIWKMIIVANSLAKNIGYNIVHHIEFDSEIKDFSEFFDNKKILENYDAVIYNNEIGVSKPTLFGSFQSYRLDKLSEQLLQYKPYIIKDLIEKSPNKIPERMFYDLLNHNSNVFEKKRELLYKNNFGISHKKWNYKNVDWCLPYYDKQDEGLWFIVWNEKPTQNLKIELIYNETTLINVGEILPNHWKIVRLDNYENAKKLTILLNNEVKNFFEFDKYREKFKKYSFREI